MDNSGRDGSFGAPYYRSPDYQIRYPAYLRTVVPPPVYTNVLDVLHPRQFFVRKMATTVVSHTKMETECSDKHVGLANRVSATTTTKPQKSTRRKKRRPVKVEVKLLNDKVQVIEPDEVISTKPAVEPVIDDEPTNSLKMSTHDVITSVPINGSAHECLPFSPCSAVDKLAHLTLPHDPTHTSHPTYPTHTSKNDTNKIYSQPASHPPSPSIPLPPPLPTLLSPSQFLPLFPLLSSSTLPPSTPSQTTLQVHREFSDDGDNLPLNPVEKLKQTAKRFERECRNRRRLTAIVEGKALAKVFAEQAKEIVIVAKSGLSYSSYDSLKQGSVTEDDRSSSRWQHKQSEYVELEQLGVGKYNVRGHWVPNSKKCLKDRLLFFH